MKCCGRSCELKHSQWPGRALQANTMFRFDHCEIQPDSRVHAFLIKSPDYEGRIFACSLVSGLKIVAETASSAHLCSGARSVSVCETFDLVYRRSGDLSAAVVSDNLCDLHCPHFQILAAF